MHNGQATARALIGFLFYRGEGKSERRLPAASRWNRPERAGRNTNKDTA